MSRENVQVVRLVLAHWAQGNFGASATLLDPEITFETFMPDASEKVMAHGSAQLQAFALEWLAQWRDYRIVGEELQSVGEDKVFASVRQIGEGRHSGVAVDAPGFAVWTIQGGKVAKLSLHYDRAEALEAVGLSE